MTKRDSKAIKMMPNGKTDQNWSQMPKTQKSSQKCKNGKKIQNINAHISKTGRCTVLNIFVVAHTAISREIKQ